MIKKNQEIVKYFILNLIFDHMCLMMTKKRENSYIFVVTTLCVESNKFYAYRIPVGFEGQTNQFYKRVVLSDIRSFCLTFYLTALTDCL